MIFIPRDVQVPCNHCVDCRWCGHRGWKREMFHYKDGPGDFWFCDTICSTKWVRFRHVHGIAHVLKQLPPERVKYLNGLTIDEYIRQELAKNCHVPLEKYLSNEAALEALILSADCKDA